MVEPFGCCVECISWPAISLRCHWCCLPSVDVGFRDPGGSRNWPPATPIGRRARGVRRSHTWQAESSSQRPHKLSAAALCSTVRPSNRACRSRQSAFGSAGTPFRITTARSIHGAEVILIRREPVMTAGTVRHLRGSATGARLQHPPALAGTGMGGRRGRRVRGRRRSGRAVGGESQRQAERSGSSIHICCLPTYLDNTRLDIS